MDAKNLEGAETILEMFFDSVLVLSVQKGFLGTILEVVLFDDRAGLVGVGCFC